MTDNTQELDEILAAKFATKPDGGAWCTIHSHRLEVGVCRSCEAKQAILDWHEQEIAEAREKSREKWQSLCGCPMCEHHSEAYRLEALRTKDK